MRVRFEERGDSVAVQVQLEVRGRLSGIADSRTLGHLWRFRDGRAIEVRAFNDPRPPSKGSRPGRPQLRTTASSSSANLPFALSVRSSG